jgi:hypothetical protein
MAADALARFRFSREQPPPGVFIQDLIMPTIRLSKDDPAPTRGPRSGQLERNRNPD